MAYLHLGMVGGWPSLPSGLQYRKAADDVSSTIEANTDPSVFNRLVWGCP